MRRIPSILLTVVAAMTSIALPAPGVLAQASSAAPSHPAAPRCSTFVLQRLARRAARLGVSTRTARCHSASTSPSSSQPSATPPNYPARCPDGTVIRTGACTGYVPPVVRGTLLIQQTAGGSSTSVAGQENVTLLGFEATAGNQDATLTRLVFRVASGNPATGARYLLVSPDITRNRMLDTVVGEATVENGLLFFRSLALPLKKNVPARLEVRTDFRRSGASDTVRVTFATDQPAYVQATGASDGRDITGIDTDGDKCGGAVCRVFVRTQQSPSVEVISLGSLYVTQDVVSVPNHQVLLGAVSDPLLRLTFRATGENVLVTRLTIGGSVESVERLELFDEGGATPIAIAHAADCAAPATGVFCAASAAGVFRVPKDTERRVLVRAVLKSDSEGGSYGGTVALTLSSSTTAPAVEARGGSSEETLAQSNGDGVAVGEVFIGLSTPGANAPIVGPTHDIVAAKIVAIENASADSDGMPVPSGTATVGAFRFRAAPSRNTRSGILRPRIKTLRFTVSGNGVAFTPGSFRIVNTASPSATYACEESALTGTFTVTCQNLHTSNVGTSVEPGSVLDLALQAQLTPSGTTRLLQVSLGQLSDRGVTGTVEWEDGVFPYGWVDVGASQVKSATYRG